MGGDLVHTGAGELHAYPFLPTTSSSCAADPVHFTTLTLDVVLVDPDNVVEPDRFFEGDFDCSLGDDGRDPGRQHLEAARGSGATGALRPDPGRRRLQGHRAAPAMPPAPLPGVGRARHRTRRRGRGQASGPRLHDHQPGEGPSSAAHADPHRDAHPDPDGHPHADGVGPGAAGTARDPVVLADRRVDRRAHQPPGAARPAVGAAHGPADDLALADQRRRGAEGRPAAPRWRGPAP